MEQSKISPTFAKSTLTGLFTGIIATIICLFFNAGYRSITYYSPAEIINVSSLIFIVNLLFLCLGLLHFLIIRLFKTGEWLYIIMFVLMTIGCIWMTKDARRSTDPLVNSQFRGLLDGVILINGICASVVIPLLFRSKKFEDEVLGTPQI